VAARRPPPGKGGGGGRYAGAQSIDQFDDLRCARLAILSDDVPAGSQLSVDELIQDERPIGDVGPGQVRALLKLSESLSGRLDQDDREAFAWSGHIDHLLSK
jgi:hypothetical protein